MGCTRITLTSELQARLAKGHNHVLEPVASRYADALAGAIAIRSSANDMLTFLAANLGFVKSPLAPAMAAMVVPRKSMGGPNLDIALAWNVQKRFGGEILMHEGTTGGYHAFAGYNPKTRIGLVALSNAASARVDDIGMHYT